MISRFLMISRDNLLFFLKLRYYFINHILRSCLTNGVE